MTSRRITGAALIVTAALVVPSTAAVAAPSGPATPERAAGAAKTASGHGDGRLARTRTPDQTRARVTVAAGSPTDAARRFLAERRSTYHIADPATDLSRISTVTEKGTTVVRFGQRYHGLPVAGAQYVVRTKDQGSQNVVSGTSGQYFSELSADTSRRLSFKAARFAARYAYRTTRWQHAPKVVDRGSAVVPIGSGVLTRHVQLSGYDVLRKQPVVQEMFIAALTGKPVLAYSRIENDGPVSTTGPSIDGGSVPLQAYQRGSSYELRDRSRAMYASDGGEIITRDAKGADLNLFYAPLDPQDLPPRLGPVTSTTTPFPANRSGANDAHWALGQVYEYYRSLGRDSIDGHGGSINAVVGVSEYGGPYPNAFWNGAYMVFGNGGYGYKPFSSSLDVVGHELTHGVVENSSNLLYLGQSGALNEAAADYMGNAIQNRVEGIGPNSRFDGLLGEDLCKRGTKVACALRDLNDKVTTKQFIGIPEDQGGVHENSVIASGTWWQIRHSLGADVADPLVYKTITQYLTPLSQFIDARDATVAAAQDSGLSSADVDKVRQAFDDHGIVAGWEQSVRGVDFTSLRTLQGFPAAQPRLADGTYVVSDQPTGTNFLSAIYTGSIAGGTSTRLSPDDGGFFDNPDTDGTTAVWTRTRLTDGRVYVQSKNLSSGTVKNEDYVTGDSFVLQLRVSGSTIVYAAPDPSFEALALTVLRPDGTSAMVEPSSGRYLAGYDVRGTQVVYAETPESQRWVRIRSYDAATGKNTVLGTFRQRRGLDLENLTVTPNHVVFTLDRTYDTAKTGIIVMDRDGSHKRTLVSESAADAPRLPTLTATDDVVTYADNLIWSALPQSRLLQRPVTGGAATYLSCSHGVLGLPAPDSARGGSSAVWLDFARGLPEIVGRTTPVGSCG